MDLRNIPAYARHNKIFEKWNELKEGEVLRIINDHNPKPLRYQFEAEYKGLYEWEYIHEGPEDWIVNIKKVAKNIITKDMTFEEILTRVPESGSIMVGYGLHCIGCDVAVWETLEQGALAHGMTETQIENLVKELNSVAN